jgi:hypothetical protein
MVIALAHREIELAHGPRASPRKSTNTVQVVLGFYQDEAFIRTQLRGKKINSP